ncbi:MAG TPA: hypothetical protein IAA15_09935 [Candidatus Olsenella pullicola]|nr:hypothetical protein [Candidatus Olsenella pullicola]
MKLLLVSHGDLAAGMASVLSNFFGMSEVSSACVSIERGAQGLAEDVTAFLDACGDEQVVICSDLMGGSANQTVMPWLGRENTIIVAGMNLPLLLQLAMVTGDVTLDEVRDMVEESRKGIVVMNDLTFEMGDDDE